jgi:hypothetical protein
MNVSAGEQATAFLFKMTNVFLPVPVLSINDSLSGGMRQSPPPSPWQCHQPVIRIVEAAGAGDLRAVLY